MLAGDQLGQVIARYLVDAQVEVRAVGEGDRIRATADIYHDDHVVRPEPPYSSMVMLGGCRS